MDLHGKIMNIPTHNSDIESTMKKLNNWPPDEVMQSFVILAYKIGHRDARHAAAELAALPPEPRTCETCVEADGITCLRRNRGLSCDNYDHWTPRTPQSADVEMVMAILKRISGLLAEKDVTKRTYYEEMALEGVDDAFAILGRIVGKEK